jgi:hypothetical protein
MKEFLKRNKVHFFYIFIIILVSILFVSINSYLQIHKMIGEGDLVSFRRPMTEAAKISILDYHQFPHWLPYYLSGNPSWATAHNTVFSFLVFFVLLAPTVALGLNLVVLFNLIFAGVFAYFLAVSLNLKQKFAIISSFIYMFNGFSMFMAR